MGGKRIPMNHGLQHPQLPKLRFMYQEGPTSCFLAQLLLHLGRAKRGARYHQHLGCCIREVCAEIIIKSCTKGINRTHIRHHHSS